VAGVANVGPVIRRRRGGVGRRPVVLGAALVAPVVLAGGLLAGELSGYERVRLERAVGVERARAVVGFGSVLVPAPGRPVRAYGGFVPAPVATTPGHASIPVSESVGAPVTGRFVAVESGVRGRAVTARAAVPVGRVERRSRVRADRSPLCAGEWVDTWMWGVCREHERERRRESDAGQGIGAGRVGSAVPRRDASVVDEPANAAAPADASGFVPGGGEGGRGGEAAVAVAAQAVRVQEGRVLSVGVGEPPG
jgi:hypothetical protein